MVARLQWLWLLVALVAGEKLKISDVYLLLPQTLHIPSNSRIVSYHIRAYEGCYTWSSADPRIASIRQVQISSAGEKPGERLVSEYQGNTCYAEAVIEPVARVEAPPAIVVTAYDKSKVHTVSYQLLKCDVMVGRIHRLEILTTMRFIRVKDFEKLYAQAYDVEGNVFSSLQGLRFRWLITSGGEYLGMSRLKDLLKQVSDQRREVENSGYHSDMVLVEGKATGRALVTLKIEEPGYENVPIAQTTIVVSEPFTIVPSIEVYVPPRALVRYRLFKILDGHLYSEIRLPDNSFEWKASDQTLLDVYNVGEIYALDKTGDGNVVVSDTVIDTNSVTCDIHVVAPDRLLITVSPYIETEPVKQSYTHQEFLKIFEGREEDLSNWNLIAGRKYVLKLRLFHKDREVYIPTNAAFDFSYALPDHWEVVMSPENKAYAVVIPQLPPHVTASLVVTKVNAKLVKVKAGKVMLADWVPVQPIADAQEATILRPLKIAEPRLPVLLPYFAVLEKYPDSAGHLAQEYLLSTTGGSGGVRWSTSDAKVVNVDSQGIVYALTLGNATITAMDVKNVLNADSAPVEVTLVDLLAWKVPRKEIVVQSKDKAEIAAFATGRRVFHNCSSIVLEWEKVAGVGVVRIGGKMDISQGSKKAGVCEVREIEAWEEGQTLLSTRLSHKPPTITFASPAIFVVSEEGRIGVFQALSLGRGDIVSIEGNNKTFTKLDERHAIVLAHGSTAELTLIGGPMVWDDLSDSHIETVKVDTVHVTMASAGRDRRVLHVKCDTREKDSKDYHTTITVFNKESAQLTEPGFSTMSLYLSCLSPYSLSLSYVLDTHQLAGLKWKSLPVGYDRFKHRLSTSLEGYWLALNDQELMVNVTFWDSKMREFYNASSIELEWSSARPDMLSYTDLTTPYFKKAVFAHKTEGPVALDVKADKYFSGYYLPSKLTDRLNTMLINNVELSPDYYSLYMHKQNMLELKVLYGSGYFEVTNNSTDIVSIDYDGLRTIKVKPLRAGRLQIRADDLGLIGSRPAFASILVSSIGNLELAEGGLMPVNSTTNLHVTAFDTDGKAFDKREYQSMGIALHYAQNSGLQTITTSPVFDQFKVKAAIVGEHQVYASATREVRSDDRVTAFIQSNNIMLDVFPPVEIIPPFVLLMPGARYTLNYRGGPDSHKFTFYNIYTQWGCAECSVAGIDSMTGLVSAMKLGQTDVVLYMKRGKDILTSAQAKVRVELVTDVSIYGIPPGRVVLQESVIRLIAVLKANGEPFTDTANEASYQWKSASPTTFEIHAEEKEEGKQVGVTGLAVSKGKCDITLHVEVVYPKEYSSPSVTRYFTSKATITVEPGMFAMSPGHRCNSLVHSCDVPNLFDSTIIMMPMRSAYSISLNKEVPTTFKCEDCRDAFVTITPSGRLTTFNQKGEVSVMVANTRVRGDVYMVDVMVTDIHSIIVDKSYEAINMPLGADLYFNVTYQDIMARSFPSGFHYGINAIAEVSDTRVLQATLEKQNSTLHIRSQYIGTALVKIYMLEDPYIKDVFQITVSSAMRPYSPLILHLGGEAQFQTTHASPAGTKGDWSVDDSNIVTVDSTGRVVAHREGETDIHYKEKSIALKSHVAVQKVRFVDIGAEAHTDVTNHEDNPNYRVRYVIPLLLYYDRERRREFPRMAGEDSNLVRQNIHVSCSTPSHSAWLSVESEQDWTQKRGEADSGSFACIITPKKDVVTTDLSASDLQLKVVVSSKGKSLYTHEEILHLRYLSKFILFKHDSQVILSGRNATHVIHIGGSCEDLEVRAETSLVSANLLRDESHCSLRFEARVTDSDFTLKKVELLNSKTGQRDQVLVSYYTDPARADPARMVSLHDIIVIAAMGVLIYILIYFVKAGQGRPRYPPRTYGMGPQIPRSPLHRPHSPARLQGPMSSPQGDVAYRSFQRS